MQFNARNSKRQPPASTRKSHSRVKDNPIKSCPPNRFIAKFLERAREDTVGERQIPFSSAYVNRDRERGGCKGAGRESWAARRIAVEYCEAASKVAS